MTPQFLFVQTTYFLYSNLLDKSQFIVQCSHKLRRGDHWSSVINANKFWFIGEIVCVKGGRTRCAPTCFQVIFYQIIILLLANGSYFDWKISSIIVGAHRVRPLQRRTNYYSPTAQDPSVVVPDTFRCHSRAKCRARSEESWAQLPRGWQARDFKFWFIGMFVCVKKGNSLRHFLAKMPPPSAEGGSVR